MIAYDVATEVLGTELFLQQNIADLNSDITFVLFSQQKPLQWKEIITQTHTYQQQNLKILSILQGRKNPHRNIFGTSYIIINMKLIIFLKSGEKTVI